jgi:NAD(P)-dependent dehydrogenase (short-subunit alcohol dehydrogenase family)
MGGFEGKVAVVTGGASGIGRATVERLSAAGAQVASFDLVDYQSEGDSTSGPVFSQHVDVTNRDAVLGAVENTINKWGHLDLLVNGAGVGAAGTVVDNDDEEWQRVFEINVMGTVRTTQAAMPHLLKADGAAIVNVGSVVALTGFPNRALYSATKGAIMSLTLAMAADYVEKGVRVNVVCPGTTDTPWIGRLLANSENPELERKNLVARQPHGRLVRPEEVAEAIAYLLSPLAGSTNGLALPVDAGINSLYTQK